MKKVKVSELSGIALDWAVAKCKGMVPDTPFIKSNKNYTFKPTTNWSQAGPIIEREKISILYHDGFCSIPKTWFACQDIEYDGVEVHMKNETIGDTPLIAAMRCYVSSKLGNEIEIPEELL